MNAIPSCVTHRVTQAGLAVVLASTLTLAAPLAVFAQNMINLPPMTNPGYNPNGQAPAIQPNTTNIAQNETVSLRGRVTTIPKGTMLMIKIDQPINSASAKMGDPVSATLENDIFINDTIAIPAGSEIIGQVASVEASTHMGRHGSIDIRFHSVKTQDGVIVPIRAHVVTTDQSGVLKGDNYSKDILKGVGIAGGGAGVGTLMGMSAGSLIGSAGAGALFGLGVGALGGMSYALIRKGKDVMVPTGSRMSITLDQPVSVNL